MILNIVLQQTLNNQELSAADVERMKHEKRELQKAVEQLEKGRDYFDQQIWEKEMQYAKKHEEVSFNQKRWRIPRVLCNKLKDAMTCKAANEKNLKNFRDANLNKLKSRGLSILY